MSIIQKPIRAAISAGDINGIGPEVILKTLSDARIIENITPIIYSSVDAFKAYRKFLGMEELRLNVISKAEEALPNKVNLINVSKERFELLLGESMSAAGTLAFLSLQAAAEDLAANKTDVLVTGPINKMNIQSDKFSFPGHTEYLSQMANVDDSLMFLVSDDLRVGVVTGHLPLKEVSAKLSTDLITRKLNLMLDSLVKDFGIHRPKVAVLGLNPHAGDNGLLGSEEKEIITPVIREFVESGQMVFGPFGADGFFGSGNYKNFDGILAMYHDQGLVPFKTLSFENGVNFTAGLPIVRTSPDHGTGYDIAGKNVASEASFRKALFLACDIYKTRKNQRELLENALKPQKKKKEA